MLLHKKGRHPKALALLQSQSPPLVGVSLLAIAVYQPTFMADVMPSSRAGSLLQGNGPFTC
ncbi:hypothetical protein AK821_20110 [Pseudomonas sp. RIT-PI-r]|nr:hypothetical protein AK821_20110 [Pseudomonas sp. RIT-PI-r]